MTTSVNQLQVKIQEKILQTTFLKNMACLKVSMPSLFDYFQNYMPKKVRLSLDNENRVNLVVDNQFVYGDDPQASSIKQVEAFLKKPPCFDFDIPIKDEDSFKYQHERVIHGLFKKTREKVGNNASMFMADDDQINFIGIIGIGLGYHIEQLFNQFEIRSAHIYEPEPDVFFAALHIVDLSLWFSKCLQLGGELTFKVGGTEESFVNEISQFFSREGYFNIVQMYLYRHYISDKTTDAFRLFHELSYRYKSGWGFCEDEIIGMSHTLTNISENKAAVLLENAKLHHHNLPVFIIGNGPSLDENLAYIKANQENVIIISSGTSLKPLLNFGITPDIHVEQERPKSIYKWVKKVGYEEILKTIPLLCLNTVYPGILTLFKKPYIALKAGDAGTSFIHEYISDKYLEMFFCNPTVTNASTSSAVSMGFNSLYLFGLDYGFKSEEDHHAKGSIYQDIKGFKMSGEFKVPGNFGGEVHTRRVFDNSKTVLEMMLEQNRAVKCINASDGAAIRFTSSCRFTELPKFTKIPNKEKVVNDILSRSFDQSYTLNHDLDKEFLSVLPDFAEYIKFLNDQLSGVTNKNELTAAFSLQFKFMNHFQGQGKQSAKSRLLFKKFFSGTLNFLQASIMNNLVRYTDKQQKQDFLQFSLQQMQQHFQFLLEDLSEHYNKPARA